MCLGLIKFLWLAVNEHKNDLQNDVDDDNAGNTAAIDAGWRWYGQILCGDRCDYEDDNNSVDGPHKCNNQLNNDDKQWL